MVTLNRTQLSQSVERRIIESADANSVRVRLELARPPTPEVRAALNAEVAQLVAHPVEGLVAPRSVQVTGAQVVFELDPIHEGAVRLSDLLQGLEGRPMSDGLAAALTATAAQLCHKIHLAPGIAGHIRLHGQCHPGNIILTPMGTVALLGTGLSTIDALLLPADLAAQMRHMAPEVAAASARDPRSDVYGLGVLFLTLLSGQTPWSDVGPEAHREALASGQLRNPGVSLQSPRPALVQVLKRAMAPEPSHRYPTALAFGQAISTELKASGRPRADGQALQNLLETAMPDRAKRGAQILGRTEIVAKTAPVPALSLGAWSDVLGESEAPTAPKPATPAIARIAMPSPPEPRGTPRLSLPPASGPSPANAASATGSITADVSALDALYDEDAPNADVKPGRKRGLARPKNPSLNDGPSPRNTLSVGGAVIAVVCALWLGFRDTTPDPAPEQLGTEVATVQNDAAPAIPPLVAPAPKPVPPPPKAKVRPSKPTGYLTVFSTPTGATVLLDGGYVGKTPLVLKHEFEDRIYELKLVQDGYLPWEKVLRPNRKSKSINEKAILEKKKR